MYILQLAQKNKAIFLKLNFISHINYNESNIVHACEAKVALEVNVFNLSKQQVKGSRA